QERSVVALAREGAVTAVEEDREGVVPVDRYEIRRSVGVQVSGPERRVGVTSDRIAPPVPEGAVAVVQEDRDPTGKVEGTTTGDQVGPAVPVQIRNGERTRLDAGLVVAVNLERAVAMVLEHRENVEIACCRHVRPTVAVHVG